MIHHLLVCVYLLLLGDHFPAGGASFVAVASLSGTAIGRASAFRRASSISLSNFLSLMAIYILAEHISFCAH
jgi:hypothetical protein